MDRDHLFWLCSGTSWGLGLVSHTGLQRDCVIHDVRDLHGLAHRPIPIPIWEEIGSAASCGIVLEKINLTRKTSRGNMDKDTYIRIDWPDHVICRRISRHCVSGYRWNQPCLMGGLQKSDKQWALSKGTESIQVKHCLRRCPSKVLWYAISWCSADGWTAQWIPTCCC